MTLLGLALSQRPIFLFITCLVWPDEPGANDESYEQPVKAELFFVRPAVFKLKSGTQNNLVFSRRCLPDSNFFRPTTLNEAGFLDAFRIWPPDSFHLVAWVLLFLVCVGGGGCVCCCLFLLVSRSFSIRLFLFHSIRGLLTDHA